jgi:ATP-dependent DNA helicase RecQ
VKRDIHSILNKYWGYTTFRPLQEEIIQTVLQGKDVLALLPTGGGKSLCFQVPAMAMDGLCLVVSPLIALMKDQVEALRAKNIPTLYIHAGMSFTEVRQTLQNASFGNYKFLYISPERIQTELFSEYLPVLKPSLLAIDEAHCISQWGYDFRPSYLKIASIREEIPGTPCIALTASATPDVQKDICQKLNFGDAAVFTQSFVRPELSYSVFTPASRQTKLYEILKNVAGSSIVYCKSRKQTQVMASNLKQQGFDAEYYHAGLNSEERSLRQENWISNRTRIIVCTNAFGMGIDKPDVRTVIHYDVPDCIENYYQEAGRAGRDNKRAYAILLSEHNPGTALLKKVDTRYPSSSEIKKIYLALMNYLQVAAGTGEGMKFDFDIETFCNNFSLDLLTSSYALDILAKLDLFSITDFQKPLSKVEFTCTKDDLHEFEVMNPELEPVIKGLLRSYEGIFEYPTAIREKALSRFVEIDTASLIMALKKLDAYRIISYETASNKPQIILLRNRMYEDDYVIKEGDLRQQHAIALERTKAMIRYLETTSCRNSFISEYFGDTKATRCMICDNCIAERDEKIKSKEFEKARLELIAVLTKKSYSPGHLISTLSHFPEKILWQVISILQDEEIIVSDGAGQVQLRRNIKP